MKVKYDQEVDILVIQLAEGEVAKVMSLNRALSWITIKTET